MRGTVRQVQVKSLMSHARDELLTDVDIPIVSFGDMYDRKPVVALDLARSARPVRCHAVVPERGHNFWCPARIRCALHQSCPVAVGVVFPGLRDVRRNYEQDSTALPPSRLEGLLPTRERMLPVLQKGMGVSKANFLMSLVASKPKWGLLGIAQSKVLHPLEDAEPSPASDVEPEKDHGTIPKPGQTSCQISPIDCRRASVDPEAANGRLRIVCPCRLRNEWYHAASVQVGARNHTER